MNFFEKAQARAHAQEVLGLYGHPDAEEIRAAFKKLAFEKHPDKGNGSAEEFAAINAAYTLLKEDKGYTAADVLRPAPTDTRSTTFRSKSRRVDGSPGSDAEDADRSSYVSPRRIRTVKSSRIYDVNSAAAEECRLLLDEIPFMAEPDPDEQSIRASILDAIKAMDAPHVPHTNHVPIAIRQSGRRISYLVSDKIHKGVNRVAVPTGAFSDKRKAVPVLVRFKSERDGAGTHEVTTASLAESFPGAKSVRLHFGQSEWPEPAEAPDLAYA